MKRIFNFLGNKVDEYEREEDWDELEEAEFEVDSDEAVNEEYYSEESGEEMYFEEEGEEEYYAEEGEDAYFEENAQNEGEPEAFYEDDYYEDNEFEEAPYYVERYEDGDYPDEELDYIEEDYIEEGEEWQEPFAVNFFEKIQTTFVNMDMVDRIVACTGVAVLILALVTGTVFASARMTTKQVNSFATVGSQLDEITVIGGDGLLAVADAQIARQEAASMVEEEQDENEGYDEEEYSKEVTVSLNMTSIKKDLKIKFVNKKTGKLIPNVPFEVEVTDPKGKTSTWVDDDKDGIIYKTNIAHGEYTVSMLALTDYDDYIISTTAKPVNVKEKLDYEKVDVSDEIKSESEIDASKEDTAQNDVAEESSLQDTVTWVESTKTAIGESYVEVAKSTIDEPKMARFDNFVKLSGLNETLVASIGGAGGSIPATGTATLTASSMGFPEGAAVTYGWSVSGAGVTPSSGSGESLTITANNTSSETQTITINLTATATVTTTSGNDSTTETKTASATATITVEAATVAPQPTPEVTISQSSLSLAVGGSATLTASLNDGVTGTITWSSSDGTIASVDGNGVVRGLKAGTAKITASYTPEGGKAVTAACTVTVTDTAVTIKLDKTSGTILVGKTLEIIPAITGNATDANKITWTSSDAAVATVTGDNTKATITGVKAGDATITASYTEGSTTVTATCTVKVQANPALDNTTALKDKNGNQIYVKNASGQYVAATYADYFKENQKFYLRQQGYKYTGWQTLDGKVYFFDANGNKVTGAQVIQGAQYSFDSNGVMVSSNGILGIDVSKWNGSIDWNAVKNSGVSYVIIRCGYRGSTQGALIEDPKYRTNIQGATAAGLKVGVYFFTQAINEIEAVEEASMVLSLVKGYNISYPIFLDVESSGGRADKIDKATRTAVCKAFCQTIKNSGYSSGVYANKTWFNSYIDAGQLGAYRIWLAQYAAQPTYAGRYDIWQYSSKGKVGGISGNVDMNLSYMGY